ncbi:hypothetical protein GN156_07360 [bacterium LRH843]|nr:hypothetical protein [bacterium LRH843]
MLYEIFVPTSLKHGATCETCPFVALCTTDFVHGLPSDGKPKNGEEAGKIGEFLIEQDLVLKNLKKGLKEWVKKNGDISIGDGAWSIKKSTPSPKVESIKKLEIYANNYDLDFTDPSAAVIMKWLETDENGDLEAIFEWTKPREMF